MNHQKSCNASIEKETYAFLLTEYILRTGSKPTRFVMLGFEEFNEQIVLQFSRKGVPVIEPERTGLLKEASILRGESERDCIILLSRTSLGKFASLITAFNILDEVLDINHVLGKKELGVYSLVDVSKWLCYKAVDLIGDHIKEKIGTLKSKSDYENIKVILRELWNLIKEKPSFLERVHPLRIIKGLTYVIFREKMNSPTNVATFLRNLGIEPVKEFESMPLFSNTMRSSTNRKKLVNNLLGYSKALVKYVSSDISSQRKNLSNMCVNLLRNQIYELAKKEIDKEAIIGKWTSVLDDFESSYVREKGRRVKKYRPESRGVRILERSKISGLPTIFVTPLEVNLEGEDRNLLKEFWNGELKRLFSGNLKHCIQTFKIEALSISDNEKSLFIKFEVLDQNGFITLDPYLDGLKDPSPKINRLLALIQRRKFNV